MSELSILAGRIRENLDELKYVVGRAIELSEKARNTGDRDYWDAVALNLHGFYTGVEHILEDIARNVDESIPTGPEWHRDLLVQMSADVKDLRPAVISRETRICLDIYRGFRYVVRNVYTFQLDVVRVEQLANELDECLSKVDFDLRAFADLLDTLTNSD